MANLANDDDLIAVGAPLPKLLFVRACGCFRITVGWEGNEGAEEVDLAPDIYAFDVYAPLRDVEGLFDTVRLGNDGYSLVWAQLPNIIEMPSTTVERLKTSLPTSYRSAV